MDGLNVGLPYQLGGKPLGKRSHSFALKIFAQCLVFLSFIQYQINCNSESLDFGCSLYWPLSLISWGVETLLEEGQTILLCKG